MRTEREKLADMLWEKAKKFILQSTVDEDIRCMMESGEYISPLQVYPPELLGEKVGEMTAEEKACHTLVYTYGTKIARETDGLLEKNPDVDLGNSQEIKDLSSRRMEVRDRLCTSLKQRFSPQYQEGKFPGVTVQRDFSVWTYVSSERRKGQEEENIPGYA